MDEQDLKALPELIANSEPNCETSDPPKMETFLIEFFGPYGGLLRAAIVTAPTAIAACERAGKEWAEAGGRTDKCTGFSVRQLGTHAELVSDTP